MVKLFKRLCGGSWFSYQSNARAAFRSHNHPTYRDADIGFRVVSFPTDNSMRTVRGGSWFNLRSLARAAYRDRNHPNDRVDLIGFRVLATTN